MASIPTSISSYSTSINQEFIQDFHSRRLLLHTPLYISPPLSPSPTTTPDPTSPRDNNNSFDANVVMVLSVLLCALICSLGLNSIIKCALRCSSLLSSDSNDHADATTTRLANTGIKKRALKSFPTISYTSEVTLPGLDTECAICLSDFGPGERVRVLPKCNHGFHVRCVDKWLNSHSSCPTCRQCLIETCNKIVGCDQATTSTSSQAIPETPQHAAARIESLPPEGLIRNHES